jgi:CheY-like chemotaxis protein
LKTRKFPQTDEGLEDGCDPPDAGNGRRASAAVLTTEEIEELAHEVNNPLAVVLANVEILAEMLAQVRWESVAHLEAPEGRSWLQAHLDEAEACLHDANEAAQRIRAALRNLRHHRARPDERRWTGPPDTSTDPKTDTKRSVLRQARVLVIDDQEAVGRALERTLRGCDVVVLTSATEALERVVGGERFDVILCDLMMPEVTGSELYDEILRQVPDQAARMIFITGGATTDQARKFLDHVALPVLAKPFDPAALRDLVRQVLLGQFPLSAEPTSSAGAPPRDPGSSRGDS